MLLLAARQCLISRGSSAPAVLSCRLAIAAVTRRPYATAKRRKSSTKAKPTITPSPPSAATVIPHSVHQDEQTLLRHISSLPVQRRHGEPFCVVLVTPSFASKLLDDVFMTKLLYRIYQNLFSTRNKKRSFDLRINVLSAVVDKLPVGRPITAPDDIDAESTRRNHELPAAAAGYEGIAYASLPAAASAPSHLVSSPLSSDLGAIDFVTSTKGPKPTQDYEVLRLPLANTVFQTGTTSTMFLSRYKTADDGHLVLQKVSREKLSHYQVHIRADSLGPKLESEMSLPGLVTSLNIPLLPLTNPRRVSGCMGNIIRRIIDTNGDEVTASSELEDVVPKFFQARGEPAQATTAWALVIPSNLHSHCLESTQAWLDRTRDTNAANEWESLWQSDPPVWTSAVANAIGRGARLHRVLSGGGGWGQKAGLLSLDPVPLTVPNPSSITDELPSMLADPEDFASTLTPVVNDGDLIQFFIQPASHISAEAARYDSEEQLKAIPEDGAVGWQLGTIPSTVDSIPGTSWQHAEPVSSGASIFRRSFGALTERPLLLTRRMWEKGAVTETSSTTTIDVPFTRFWKLGLLEVYPPKTKKSGNKPKAVGVSSKKEESKAAASDSKGRLRADEEGASTDRPLLTSQKPLRSLYTTGPESTGTNKKPKSQQLQTAKGNTQISIRRVLSANVAEPPVNETQSSALEISRSAAEQGITIYNYLKKRHRGLHRLVSRLTDEYNAVMQRLAERGITPSTLAAARQRQRQRQHERDQERKRKRERQNQSAVPRIRKVKHIPHDTPSSIIKQFLVISHQLARLATFTHSLLFQICGTRGIRPILRRTGVKVIGGKAGRRMWLSLGVKRIIRPNARRSDGNQQVRRRVVKRRVRRVTVGAKRVVRGYISAPSLTRTHDSTRGKGHARVRKVGVGRGMERMQPSPRRQANKRRSADKRNGAKELEELTKSWLS